MEKFRVYVVPASHTADDNPNTRPQTRVFKSRMFTGVALGLAPAVDEAFLVESDSRKYNSSEEFYEAVKKATANLGPHCTYNLMESLDNEGIWDVTRLVVDKSNPIKYERIFG